MPPKLAAPAGPIHFKGRKAKFAPGVKGRKIPGVKGSGKKAPKIKKRGVKGFHAPGLSSLPHLGSREAPVSAGDAQRRSEYKKVEHTGKKMLASALGMAANYALGPVAGGVVGGIANLFT